MLNYQQPLDNVYHALSDPGRRIIVQQLAAGPASVSSLAKPLSMTLSAVMQHLSVLEQSGLVRSEKKGRVRTCTLESAALTKAETWLSERRAMWATHLDRLEDFLQKSEEK